MAPLRSSRSISSLQVPQMPEHALPSMAPFYSSDTLSCSTTHLSTILSSSTSELEDSENSAVLSPRTLYALSFDRPASARSLPSGRFRKNMKEITGFGTTEEDFEALPIAIQRKSIKSNMQIDRRCRLFRAQPSLPARTIESLQRFCSSISVRLELLGAKGASALWSPMHSLQNRHIPHRTCRTCQILSRHFS
ncbi:uncharacterized protein LY89DRAFT_332632 [Mollisia scopiformis]|uniref:Uncharacterized protein n=1 Tax=Mollisia scopiformis TaxID=149040 RepID=A0A132B7Z4_MOLSC|nr:uncharacterized protein LY89DRAFT_332632 [Mollisia scopiformis]KUJ08526.1 hypothetical protein LY89DRAFT_332632 [Mollisia scopiformis]